MLLSVVSFTITIAPMFVQSLLVSMPSYCGCSACRSPFRFGCVAVALVFAAVVVSGDCCSCRRRTAVTVAFAVAAAVTVVAGEHQSRFTCSRLLQEPRVTRDNGRK